MSEGEKGEDGRRMWVSEDKRDRASELDIDLQTLDPPAQLELRVLSVFR